ncbi:MAG: UDP-glucose/GDP-mannose dehydrogenase family protein, partial [Deltaproteobacteria bacterium]|nr:UDP-glucose/GDP-mannose dehydrogenase family protein [Deltaproteobacteria bacterium]
IGYEFLYPGLGFGGSCFPKDLRALVRTGDDLGVRLELARAAVVANEAPVPSLIRRMEAALGDLAGKTIALWGLAFKPRTDDVREAPALRLAVELIRRGARVRAMDPQAVETARAWLESHGVRDGVELFHDPYTAAEGADALVLATEWTEFRAPDLDRLRAALRGRHVFDGRNAMIPDEVAEAGLVHHGMGRPARGR